MYIIKIFVLIFIWVLNYACENPFSKNKKNEQNFISVRDSSIVVFNGDYYLLLNTTFYNDTLSEESSFNERFSTPIILSQKVTFFDKNGKRLKIFIPSFNEKDVLTVENKRKKIPAIYLWDICLLKRKFDSFYYIYGSGICNGTLCPEYYAFFDQTGNLLGEGYSDIYAQEFKKEKITTLQNSLKINIDSVSDCKSIINLWKE